jgi:hypothetical protein
MRFALFISLLLFNHLAAAEELACPLSGRQTIEIPLAWRFATPNLNTLWVAEALKPRINASGFRSFKMKQTQVGDSFRVTFCLASDDSKVSLGKFTFWLGDDPLSLKARPIKWLELRNEKNQATSRYGKMTEITIPARPDVKTLLFLRAVLTFSYDEVNTSRRSEPRLKIECFNPSIIEHPGVALRLDVVVHSVCYKAPLPRTSSPQVIPIRVRFGKRGVDTSGGDLAFPGEFFKRTLEYKEISKEDKVGWLKLSLGESGPLAPGQNVLRYAFSVEGEPVDEQGKLLEEALVESNRTLSLAFGPPCHLELSIKGSNVFPTSIPLLRKVQFPGFGETDD